MAINHGSNSVPVSMVRGDDFTTAFRIGGKESEGDPLEYWDLTGWTLRGQVRSRESSEVILATIEAVPFPDQGDEENKGKFSVFIARDEASNMGTKMFPRECVGDIEFIDPSGLLRTYFTLNMSVAPDVTRVS